MSEFEDGLNRMRGWQTVTDEADALVVIAEGLAEVIALLRPLLAAAATTLTAERPPCSRGRP